MRVRIEIGDTWYSVETKRVQEISIPLAFHGPQPESYGAPRASAEPYRAGGFIGDVRLGGSVNVETCHFTPHCNGTHTESVGHIVDERVSIVGVVGDLLVPAALGTVTPVSIASSGEHCKGPHHPHELVITRAALVEAFGGINPQFLGAVIIRTLPNDETKLRRNYDKQPPPFFTIEAAEYISQLPVRHLLVDVPSLDRADDGGLVTAHHLYWDVPEGTHHLTPLARRDRTITEFVYVSSMIPDGVYAVSLEVAPFVLDAAPSRVRLFPLSKEMHG